MMLRVVLPFLLAGISALPFTGCGPFCSACRTAENAAVTVPARNLTDAEVRVDEVTTGEEGETLLRATVVKAAEAGGAASIAEPGQSIVLRPASSGNAATGVGLRSLAPGSTLRCRIALDAAGVWRILSVE